MILQSRLTEYAASYNADSERWLFLRASDSVVQRLAQDAFHVAIAEGTDPEEPIIHSSKFFVVDAEGEVRGIFDGRSEEGRKEPYWNYWDRCESFGRLRTQPCK